MTTATETTRPPVERFEYATGGPEEAHAFMRRTLHPSDLPSGAGP